MIQIASSKTKLDMISDVEEELNFEILKYCCKGWKVFKPTYLYYSTDNKRYRYKAELKK